MAAASPALVLRIGDAEDTDRHERAPLEAAGTLLRGTLQPGDDLPPRVWLSIFIASLRAAREAVVAHAREAEAAAAFAPVLARHPERRAAIREHIAEHRDLVTRISETIRVARSCKADDTQAVESLRFSALLVAGRLAAHENRTRGLLAGTA